MTLKAPYVLALCQASQDHMVFGLATRLGSQTKMFDLQAAKVIHSIVQFSPAAESVAIEFLNEFNKVSQLNGLGSVSLSPEYPPPADDVPVTSVLSDKASADTHQWAQDVLSALCHLNEKELSTALKPVLDLASNYLTHLLIAVLNPSGPKTPQVSTSDSPEILQDLAHITALIDAATNTRNQAALKKLVYARDGYHCALTDVSFDPAISIPIKAQCAHIIPFSLHNKEASLRIIESFTGNEFTAEEIIANINHPRNAFHVQSDARDQFDQLNWGIEAITHADGQIKYIYRQVAKGHLQLIRRSDGDELSFNRGTKSNMIDGPDPRYCNLKLAIARALHACGAAEIIADIYADYDDDDFVLQPTYFGGPFVPDELLCLRLADRLAPYV